MNQESNAPFSARSVLASALLGADPPALPVAHLVRLAGLFGINGNRARVALSRMVAAGEATTDGSGRYELAGHLLDRRARQTASRTGRTGPWTGSWHLVVVTTAGSGADVRTRRRKDLAFARLGELREGVWTRPDNLPLALPDALSADIEVLSARPSDGAGLAARLWPLERWATGAEELLARLDSLVPRGPGDLAPGFALSASVLRHLQADPLLPPDLLPPRWPGDRLRRRYDRWDARYRSVLTRWGREGGRAVQ
jgi:phenylacetic acid degradation operon negative regulatory protein